jgi:hypothetical protein
MSKQFVVGKTYYTRSICDHDCVWGHSIKSRTAKFVTLGNGKRFKVSLWNGVETIKPQGSYSMCPILRAEG